MPYPPNVPRGSYGPKGPLPPSFPWGGMMQGPPMIPRLYWDAYSDEQRIKELWRCFDQIADRVNQLGYYYIPDFAGTWSATQEYPPLTVVEAPSGIQGVTAGDSYTALDWVPVGTSLTDETYWARTGNYNAQVAALQEMVEGYDARITAAQDTAAAAQTAASDAQEAVASKAPKVHADDDASTYGGGTGSLYGHVKLSDTPSESGVASSVAATPKAVSDAIATAKAYTDAHTAQPAIEIVTIGDSFTARSGNWTTFLPDAYTVHNYAVSGSGFLDETATNQTFRVQAQKAIDEISDKDSITHVIVCGGLNDFLHGQGGTDCGNECVEVYTMLRDAFPKAKVVVAYGNAASPNKKNFTRAEATRWNGDFANASNEINRVEITYILSGFRATNVYESDDVHPNASGMRIYAGFFDAIINGNDPFVPRYLNPSWSEGQLTLRYDSRGNLKCSGRIAFNGATAGETTLGSVNPTRYQTFNDQSNYPLPAVCSKSEFVAAYVNASSGNFIVRFSAAVEGSFGLYF